MPLHLQVEKSGEAEGLSADAQLLRDKSNLELLHPSTGYNASPFLDKPADYSVMFSPIKEEKN